ncbi:hypothetical protein SAMN02787100_1165 [Chryseobacterium sp. OV279]|nr:hypothetical protein SAMN02787100_1165 [Chryseobacterium sp. OV279]
MKKLNSSYGVFHIFYNFLKIIQILFICLDRVPIVVLGGGGKASFCYPPPPLKSHPKVFSRYKNLITFLKIFFRLQSKVRTGLKRFSTNSKYLCYFIEYHPIFITFGIVFDYYKPTKNPINTTNIEWGSVKNSNAN